MDLPEVSHVLQFRISSTRAGGQDDVSSNKSFKSSSSSSSYTLAGSEYVPEGAWGGCWGPGVLERTRGSPRNAWRDPPHL